MKYHMKYGIKYVSLFPPDAKYEQIFERIKYLIQRKGDILDIYYYDYMKIEIDSDEHLPSKKNIKHEKCDNIYWTRFQ